MSGRPAARLTDSTAHGSAAAPGPGSPDTRIEGLPAWRTLIDQHQCPLATPTPHGPEVVLLGSTTVMINFKMATRQRDFLQGAGPPDTFSGGASAVLIGDVGFGMASPDRIQAYATAMRGLLDTWTALTPAQRLAALARAVGDALPDGMPPLAVRSVDLPGTTRGQFDFATWSIELNAEILEGEMDEARLANLSETLYHEGRHGEQWYNAAQHRAHGGASSDALTREMGIPQGVAEAAARDPATASSAEGAMGETVYTSVYGSRGDYRNDVLTQDTDESYIQYRALPEEQDAWRQGGAAEDAFLNPSAP